MSPESWDLAGRLWPALLSMGILCAGVLISFGYFRSAVRVALSAYVAGWMFYAVAEDWGTGTPAGIASRIAARMAVLVCNPDGTSPDGEACDPLPPPPDRDPNLAR